MQGHTNIKSYANSETICTAETGKEKEQLIKNNPEGIFNALDYFKNFLNPYFKPQNAELAKQIQAHCISKTIQLVEDIRDDLRDEIVDSFNRSLRQATFRNKEMRNHKGSIFLKNSDIVMTKEKDKEKIRFFLEVPVSCFFMFSDYYSDRYEINFRIVSVSVNPDRKSFYVSYEGFL